ncbi:hypothetical protein [Rhodothermus profundi]|uniref:Uncharacterized protein n=1 Tax=Rhodothermus profundi TaxID=633813 RepID=A0A1M6QP62_9BACT|nr:hypothetical protein [Rhodothermus profundi]SHK22006.1 hypothetical protein SAMN04488087_0706 [Rhodothermus profundi]
MNRLLRIALPTGVGLLLIAGCALIEPSTPVEKPASECDEQPPRINWNRFFTDTSLLPGTWQWVKTTVYFTTRGGPSVQTPCSAGYTETLRIRPGGIVEVYRNDTLVYRLSLQDFLDSYLVWGVNKDSLILSSVPVDGPEYIYVRTQ